MTHCFLGSLIKRPYSHPHPPKNRLEKATRASQGFVYSGRKRCFFYNAAELIGKNSPKKQSRTG